VVPFNGNIAGKYILLMKKRCLKSQLILDISGLKRQMYCCSNHILKAQNIDGSIYVSNIQSFGYEIKLLKRTGKDCNNVF
jgi:hypothetical protein